MPDDVPRQPGDIILDRYMPNASLEKREAARERLKRLAALIVRVHKRLLNEEKASVDQTGHDHDA